MKSVGKIQPTHSANMIKTPNGFRNGQRICLCAGGKRRVVIVNKLHLKTKWTDRKFILVHDPEHPCRTSRIYLDNYGVEPYPNCKWEQARWIEEI